ncbi:hypothetical protein [Sulfidibacter corallicola]|uniref:Uncharacterized protein n=1 Tax=Sulfidibacter corallicola TaxID=2818388 RepID=A0A8A4TU51_SULCO|nr:hypothetical protein [Sulfidibacter corallicola]QTD53489.1 hypothetical protein J3U87_13625 [Sulfidibacter corallicola]
MKHGDLFRRIGAILGMNHLHIVTGPGLEGVEKALDLEVRQSPNQTQDVTTFWTRTINPNGASRWKIGQIKDVYGIQGIDHDEELHFAVGNPLDFKGENKELRAISSETQIGNH